MSKFGTNCGSEMEDSAKFCPKCGTPVQTGKNGLNCKNYGTRKHRSFLFYVLFYDFSFTGISKSICLTSRFPFSCAKYPRTFKCSSRQPPIANGSRAFTS